MANPVITAMRASPPPTPIAVAQIAGDWQATFNAGNKEGLRDLITDDIAMHQAEMPAITGADGYIAFFSAPPEFTNLVITVDEVDGHGNLGYAAGTYTGDIALPDGSTANVPGKWLIVVVEGADGKWRISRHTASVDVPGP